VALVVQDGSFEAVAGRADGRRGAVLLAGAGEAALVREQPDRRADERHAALAFSVVLEDDVGLDDVHLLVLVVDRLDHSSDVLPGEVGQEVHAEHLEARLLFVGRPGERAQHVGQCQDSVGALFGEFDDERGVVVVEHLAGGVPSGVVGPVTFTGEFMTFPTGRSSRRCSSPARSP